MTIVTNYCRNWTHESIRQEVRERSIPPDLGLALTLVKRTFFPSSAVSYFRYKSKVGMAVARWPLLIIKHKFLPPV